MAGQPAAQRGVSELRRSAAGSGDGPDTDHRMVFGRGRSAAAGSGGRGGPFETRPDVAAVRAAGHRTQPLFRPRPARRVRSVCCRAVSGIRLRTAPRRLLPGPSDIRRHPAARRGRAAAGKSPRPPDLCCPLRSRSAGNQPSGSPNNMSKGRAGIGDRNPQTGDNRQSAVCSGLSAAGQDLRRGGAADPALGADRRRHPGRRRRPRNTAPDQHRFQRTTRCC